MFFACFSLFVSAGRRAVSAANILAELTLPFVRIGGFAVFYKGQDYQNELQNAYYAIHLLGGQLIDTIQFELPLNYGTRSLIIIQKTSTTPPTYPRKAGTPQKKPLEQ
jgi:16S rRNA (guanine527-N7)-methyltransferase